MATTTSNFGWPIPQSTDLVKDGATAIASLGSGVDTSMAELKGGTTGQILSKTSNTDMDFTWINNDQGDITGVTAGTGLTGGGTSGDVTVSFDVANYGGGQYAAGKNKIINGDFGIWQRGTSFTSPSSVYTADRFVANAITSDVVSQQTFTPGSAPVSGYESQYYLRYATSATAGGRYLFQKIEDVRTLAGQAVTFSFWAKVNTGTATLTTYFYQQFGSGGSADVQSSTQNNTVTTSWQRFTFATTMPSVSGKTIGSGSCVQAAIYFTDVSKNLDIWGIQVEAGSTATAFQTATGTKQGELAACQRYYYRNTAPTATAICYAIGRTTTIADVLLTFPVTMRTNPTAVETGGTFDLTNPNVGAWNVTSFTFVHCSYQTAFIKANTASGLTQGVTYELGIPTNGYVGFSAEL